MDEINYEGLEEHEIESWEDHPISNIYPFLRGDLFHRTNFEGYRGIREAKQILPNTGQFPYTYPQSEFSYGANIGGVSLFDFTSASDRDCISIHLTWGGFFFDQKPATIVFRMDKEFLSQKLISNSDAPKLSDPQYKGYIPFIEAWYPEPIPFDAIVGIIISMDRGFGKLPIIEEYSMAEIKDVDLLIDNLDRQWKEMLNEIENQGSE
jgi:hypothetical protein